MSYYSRSVNFLDISIFKEADGGIGSKLYRKKTARNQVLHANSFHPMPLKRSINYSHSPWMYCAWHTKPHMSTIHGALDFSYLLRGWLPLTVALTVVWHCPPCSTCLGQENTDCMCQGWSPIWHPSSPQKWCSGNPKIMLLHVKSWSPACTVFGDIRDRKHMRHLPAFPQHGGWAT